jgi:hypothetical protein
MEIRLELLAYKNPKERPDQADVILVAYFTMAARDPKTMAAAPGTTNNMIKNMTNNLKILLPI